MPKLITIVYLIDTIAQDTAGTEKQLLETIKRLDRDRFTPFLVCLWESQWMRDNPLPCPCHILGYKGFLKPNFPKVVRNLVHIIENKRIDIVQTFFEDSIFVGLLGKLLARKHIALISSRRDIGLGSKNRPWYHSLYAIVQPLANIGFSGIITNSQEVKRYVSKREKTSLEKIKVIHNGISIPDTPSEHPAVFSKKNDSTIWIGITASLTPVKRHDVLFQAVSELRQRRPELDFRLLLLGDGPERNKLRQLARKLQIEDHVYFQGAVKDVPSYLYNLDIGVLCSDREGLSNAIMEYMACGLPVIATAVGGNVELIDEANGLLVPPGDPGALANALEHLIDQPELRKKLGEAGKKKIKENFSWEKTINELQNYYISLVNNSI